MSEFEIGDLVCHQEAGQRMIIEEEGTGQFHCRHLEPRLDAMLKDWYPPEALE